MNGEKYWVLVRMKDNNVVTAEGPYDYKQAKREYTSVKNQLGTSAEVGLPIIAETKAEALDTARKRVGNNPEDH